MQDLYAEAHAGDLAGVIGLAAPGHLDEPADDLGWSALMVAAAPGHAEVVRWLLDAGARPDLTGAGGDTALSLAPSRGRTEVVGQLIGDDRVDVNARDRSGWTPL